VSSAFYLFLKRVTNFHHYEKCRIFRKIKGKSLIFKIVQKKHGCFQQKIVDFQKNFEALILLNIGIQTHS
jgi:hypothetical protein